MPRPASSGRRLPIVTDPDWWALESEAEQVCRRIRFSRPSIVYTVRELLPHIADPKAGEGEVLLGEQGWSVTASQSISSHMYEPA